MSDTIVAISRSSIIKLECKMFPATPTFSLSRIEDLLCLKYISTTKIDEGFVYPEDVFLYEVKNKGKFMFAVMKYDIDFTTVKPWVNYIVYNA